jgi:hypothetical protein
MNPEDPGNKTVMMNRFPLHRLAAFILLAFVSAKAEENAPLFETFDLDVGETVTSRSGEEVTLVSVDEPKGEVWGEISRPVVTVSVDGNEVILVAGMYRLPVSIPGRGGGVQIDCPITGGLRDNSHIDHWALEKDARLRVWPGNSPWIAPGTFGYPLKQRWFASHTAFSNEPVAPRPDGRLYYHAGLDLGGCEGLTEVIAATDALIVSVGNKILPGHEPTKGSPVNPRYDVLYLLDDRGWYYRYSHLHSFDQALRPGMRVKLGQRLGLLGKEGGSGGWTHLHFEAKSRQPSGRWGTQDAYAFLWQGYRAIHDPELIAVARPGHICFEGDSVTHDGSRSWAQEGEIERYRWQFSDGSTADGASVRKRYDVAGSYRETLTITDSEGQTDVSFVRVQVFRRGEGGTVAPPRVHATYHPTFGIRAGESITFQVRSFGTTHGEETWDFGDGSEPVTTRSDGNVEQLAKDGYAVVEHVYKKPGDYLVHVWRRDEKGILAEDRLFVRVGEER